MSDYQFPYKDASFLVNHLLDFEPRCLFLTYLPFEAAEERVIGEGLSARTV